MATAMLDQLRDYGLTEIQAKVYYHLLTLGTTSSTKIAKQLDVHRSEVYRVLRELAEEGAVTEKKGRRPILYAPTPPEEVLDILLQEQAKTLQRLKEEMPRVVAWLNSHRNIKNIRSSVLLVDDDETIRKTLTLALTREGFSVNTAPNGKQALKKSQLKHYDLALVDIRLPDMEGTKLLKMLRDKNPEIKEIIITGYPSIENAVQAVNDGADAYFVKPLNPPDLLAKIREKLKT
jgi:ActR/RegA family two-component response regulator/predicted DNA-binding transcriptional regulator